MVRLLMHGVHSQEEDFAADQRDPPEVLEAQRSGRELILSVYDIAGGAEREIRLDAKPPPESVGLRPETSKTAGSI